MSMVQVLGETMRKLQREYWRYVLTLDLLRAELLARKVIAKK